MTITIRTDRPTFKKGKRFDALISPSGYEVSVTYDGSFNTHYIYGGKDSNPKNVELPDGSIVDLNIVVVGTYNVV